MYPTKTMRQNFSLLLIMIYHIFRNTLLNYANGNSSISWEDTCIYNAIKHTLKSSIYTVQFLPKHLQQRCFLIGIKIHSIALPHWSKNVNTPQNTQMFKNDLISFVSRESRSNFNFLFQFLRDGCWMMRLFNRLIILCERWRCNIITVFWTLGIPQKNT